MAMRLPGIRFTVRQMMVVVAIVCVLLELSPRQMEAVAPHVS
jgi:hypothetical protein